MFVSIEQQPTLPLVERMLAAAILAAALVLISATPAPALARDFVAEEWVETSTTRFVSPQFAQIERTKLASYGPFRVLSPGRAALVEATDQRTPTQFAAMLIAFPTLATIEFIECPGTYDDRANLRLGRMIRAAGLTTEVPAGGSVRSGAVDLFLAGTTRSIADDAEFAVHAWLDDRGMGARDYASDAPEHAKYLVYYREMGMSSGEATRFYAMTNSVRFDDARWMTGAEMRGWMGRTTLRLQGQPPRHTSSRSIARRNASAPTPGYAVQSQSGVTCTNLHLLAPGSEAPSPRQCGTICAGLNPISYLISSQVMRTDQSFGLRSPMTMSCADGIALAQLPARLLD